MREKKDAKKSRARFWEMSGSKMGEITGLTQEEKEQAEKQRQEALNEEGLDKVSC